MRWLAHRIRTNNRLKSLPDLKAGCKASFGLTLLERGHNVTW